MTFDKSVLKPIGKLFEKIQLQFNQKNFTLHSSQHGFTNGHSTVSALVSIAQPWFNATDNTCC